jgi:hypothetical protein
METKVELWEVREDKVMESGQFEDTRRKNWNTFVIEIIQIVLKINT